MQAPKTESTPSALYRRTNCRYCQSRLSEPFLDLGTQPLANSFLEKSQLREKEFTCPLRLSWCPQCHLVQLADVVPADRMFSNYLYVSSTTRTFQRHFAEYAEAAKSKVLKKDSTLLAVDIGSNDGLLLSCYQKEGMTAVGVEPAKNLAEQANRAGFTTIGDYFGARAVETILKTHGPADIVSANNVFAHIDDIYEVCRNVQRLLHPQGIWIIEFPYLLTMVEHMLFDMIYHEHLSYIALSPLQYVLSQFQFEILSVQRVSSHGGSLRVFIQKKNGGHPIASEVREMIRTEAQKGFGSERVYLEFAGRVLRVHDELMRRVEQIKTEGKRISGYGAPAKGNTLINFCAFTSSQIDFIVDDNPLKQNLFTPGARIPVVSGQHLAEHPTDYIFLFAWNFAEEIMKKLDSFRKKGVCFLVPLPHPRIA